MDAALTTPSHIVPAAPTTVDRPARAAPPGSPVLPVSPVDPGELARLALVFQRRLDRLPDDIDDGWAALNALRPALDQMPDGPSRRRLMLTLYRRWCGPLPDPRLLATPGGRLALHGRLGLLSRLCAVALAGRPGVLRCCVEIRARRALEGALGPAMAALRESARQGAVVPAQVAAWSPIQWACVGYADLALAGAWPHRGLRRLVRLALPARWPVPDGRHQVPVRHACALEGLARLDALFAKEPT